MRHAGAILLFVFLTARALTAQSDGQRVRVTSGHYDLRRATGDGVGATADSIAIQVRQTARGAAIGFSLGAAAGFVFGMLNYKECVPEGIGINCLAEPVTAANSAVLGAAAFGLAGAGVGALIGSMFHSRRWKHVEVNVVPERDQGLRLAVSFRTH